MIWFYYVLSALFLVYYLILILYISKGLNPPVKSSENRLPAVSLLIPCHNEEQLLPQLMQCLDNLIYPANHLEIIFINDRSTDGTESIIQRYVEKNPHKRHYLKIKSTPQGISPKKWALTQGIKQASGEIIITTDADTLPQANWINTMISFYQPDTGMVLGYAPYRTDGKFNTLFHHCLALEYYGLAVIAAASAGMGNPSTCNGANLSYRRELFEQIDGFGDTIKWISGDDDLLMHRVKQLSPEKITYALDPQAAVFTDPPYTLHHFIRQRIRFSSKHLAYPAQLLVFLFGVYLYFLTLLIQLIGSFFIPAMIIPFLIQLGIKAAGELYLLNKPLKWMESRPLLRYYPLTVIPHLFYVVLFPVLGQLMKPRWK